MSADTRKLVTNENLSAFAEALAEKVPLKSDLPTKVSDLANDRGFTDNAGTITSVTINGVTTSSGGVNLGYLVGQESGKGLSSNDYTTAEKNKLAGIDSGAEANTIETVKVNGTALTPDGNKAVNVSVPTTVAELSDAANYALASDLEDYAQVSDLEDTEEVLTAAVTDLNDRLEEAEDSLENIQSALSVLAENDPLFSNSPASEITTSDITNWNGKQDALTFDSVPTQNSTNPVTSGGLYTVITQNEYTAATALNDLNGRVSDLEEIEVPVVDQVPTENSTNAVSSGGVYAVIEENEFAVAAALSELNSKVNTIPENISDLHDDVGLATSSDLSNYVLKSDYEDDEEVIASAVNDLNDRLTDLEEAPAFTESDPVFSASAAAGITSADITNWNGKTSNTGTLTGVSFNGTSATVTNGVAAITATIPEKEFELLEYSITDFLDGASALTTLWSDSRAALNAEKCPCVHLTSMGGSSLVLHLKSFDNTEVVYSAVDSEQIYTLEVTSSGVHSYTSLIDRTPYDVAKGSNLTADKLILGNGSHNIKASTYGVTTTAPTSSSDDTTIPTSKAVYDAIDSALTAALVYRGTIGSSGATVSSLPAAHSVGDVYVVSVAGTYAGKACEVGDYIICNTDGTSASDAHWNVVTGENQVDNKSASLAAAGSSATIATVDGTNLTITTPSEWTGVDKTGTITGINMNGASKGTSGVIDLGTVITSETALSKGTATGSGNAVTDISVSGHQITLTKGKTFLESFTETDPVFSASPAAGITASDITNWNGKTSNTGTLTGVTFNGTAATVTNGVAAITGTSDYVIDLPSGWSNGQEVNLPSGTYNAALSAFNAGRRVVIRDVTSEAGGWVGTPVLLAEMVYNVTDEDGWTGLYFAPVSMGSEIISDFHIGTSDQLQMGYEHSRALTEHATHKLNIGSATATAASSNTITYVESLTGTSTATSGNLTVTPTLKTITVPSEVTESTVSGWGFTKNTGTLTTETDPVFSASAAAGITSADITNWNGKTSNTGTITGITMNGASKGTSGVVNLGTVVTSETDPVFSASPAAGITSSDITNWNSKTSNTGTLTGVKVNGSNATVTSGVADIGTVITSETQLSKGTTSGSGNAVTDISVSNHQITLTKGTTFLTSHQSIKTINNQTITGTGNVSLATLPTVSSSDNGKILQVVNGVWTLVSPATIYSGTGTPSNSMGNDGDIYLQA